MSQENVPAKGKKCFDAHNISVVKKSDERQENFRTFVKRHDKFDNHEKAALQIDTIARFEQDWKQVLNAKSKFNQSHEHGVGLAMEMTRNVAACASDILQNMEPIVTLVKDFGAPYGGMAIGTICFLFTIASRRVKMEQQISDMLFQIRDRVPGLKLYAHIYNDTHELSQQLQSKVVEAYDGFIGFCMEATQYYVQGGMRRFFSSMWGSTSLDDQASRVQKAIVDVRYMSEELLNKNIHEIKLLNTEQAKTIQDLKAKIEDLQGFNDTTRLHEIQKLLGVEAYSTESEIQRLKSYGRDINAYSEEHWSFLERMQGNRLGQFKSEDPKFKTWQQSACSSMLILVGINDDYRDERCWLSPLALDIIDCINKPKQADSCAFYIHTQEESDPSLRVLSCILLQLLRRNRQALRDDTTYDQLRIDAKAYFQEANSYDQEGGGYCGGDKIRQQEYSVKSYKLLQEVALQVLNMLDLGEGVWIILDRVDKYRQRKKLLKVLGYLVEKANVKVRVLAIVDGYVWALKESERDEFVPNDLSRISIHKMTQAGANEY